MKATIPILVALLFLAFAPASAQEKAPPSKDQVHTAIVRQSRDSTEGQLAQAIAELEVLRLRITQLEQELKKEKK